MRDWLERLAVVALSVSALGAANAAPQPQDPVVMLHAGLVRVFAAPGGPSEPAIEALAVKEFDMAAITMDVLGDAAASTTQAERSRLNHVLAERLARQIALAGRQSANDGFAVVAVKSAGGADWMVTTVEGRQGASGQPPAPLVWRVRREGARFRIVDTLRGGLSTVGVQHDELAAQRKGRPLDAVIAQMEQRAAAPSPQF